MSQISEICGFSIVWFVCDLTQKYHRKIGIVIGVALGFWIFGWWFLIPIALGEPAVYITKKWLGSDDHEVKSRWPELIHGIARVWLGWLLWLPILIIQVVINFGQTPDGLTVIMEPYPAEYYDP